MPESALLSTAFIPPIWYAAVCIQLPTVQIEMHENYQKRTARNRCYLQSSQGPLLISVPLAKGKHERCPITEVIKANDTRWLSETTKSITSSYRNAPFYDHYIEPIQKALHAFNQDPLLWSANEALLKGLWALIGIDTVPTPSKSFTHVSETHITELDLRYVPLRFVLNEEDKIPRYHQVFEASRGFQGDLSVIDLIMEKGPESLDYLKQYPIKPRTILT